jgi:hypothetical protein
MVIPEVSNPFESQRCSGLACIQFVYGCDVTGGGEIRPPAWSLGKSKVGACYWITALSRRRRDVILNPTRVRFDQGWRSCQV